MLTVLHRAPDGSERYFEARTVRRVNPDGVECIPASGTIKAYGDFFGSDIDAEQILDISGPFGAVFVMNRHGATVARYVHP